MDIQHVRMAGKLVVSSQQASTSLIQRRLKIPYKDAQWLIDSLERAKIIGPFKNSKEREVLIGDQASLGVLLDQINNNEIIKL